MYTELYQSILEKNYGERISCSNYVTDFSYTKKFCKAFIKSDEFFRNVIIKLMDKALQNPEHYKFLSTNRKGQIEIKTGKDRFYYILSKEENLIEFIEFSPKKKQK